MKESSNTCDHRYQKNNEAICFPNRGQTTHYISISLYHHSVPLQNCPTICYTTFAHSTMDDAQKEMQNAYYHGYSSVQRSGVVGLSRPVIHN
jgi:hypothetical protein